jgi:hypothetical protein
MARLVGPLAIASFVLCACGSPKDAAREEFGRQWSCPLEQVQATPKPDVRWSTLALRPAVTEPSPEVKADPARLAKWKKDQEDSYAPLREALDTFDVFSVTGCGHTTMLGCKRPAKSNGPNRVICQAAPDALP